MNDRLDEQIGYFKAIVAGKFYQRDTPTFRALLAWIKQFPGILTSEQSLAVRNLVCSCTDLSEIEFLELLRSSNLEGRSDGAPNYFQIEREFDELVPRDGWLRHYIDFTSNLESPYAYHLYCGLVGVGAILNRQVYIDMGGQFRVYPALGVMLLGPSGVKKTTAGDVIVGLLQEGEFIKVYQDKITPEGLIEAMKGEDNAVGLVYAPEMSVFLGKQRYMEGVIPLITRLMDCPTNWSSATIMRGNSVLRNVGISCLFCSTPDWFIKNTPPDTFGGGFIARYLLVVQQGTARVFPIPVPVQSDTRSRLVEELRGIASMAGVVTFEPEVYHRNGTGIDSGCYVDWYREFKTGPRNLEHELLGTYTERKPIHVLRLAMVIHISTHHNLVVCRDCFERSLRLCTLSERFLPGLMRQMFKTSSGEEQEAVIACIRKAGGVITHSDLVRKLQYKMKAEQTKGVIASLKEAEMVKEVRDNLSRRYILVEIAKE